MFDDVGPQDAATFAEQVVRELPAHGGMLLPTGPITPFGDPIYVTAING